MAFSAWNKRFSASIVWMTIAVCIIGLGIWSSTWAAEQAAPQACAPVPEGLTNWWVFDETYEDLVSGMTGTPSGMLSIDGGYINGAVYFDAGSLEYPNNFEFDPAGYDFSFTSWVLVRNTNQHTILDRLPGGANGYRFSITNSVPLFEFSLDDGVTTEALVADYSIPSNTWTHVAWTIDRATGTVVTYVNGSTVATHSIPVNEEHLWNEAPIYMGSNGGTPAFDGGIDDTDMYTRALYAQEVMSLYQAGTDGKCSLTAPTATPVQATYTAVPPTNTPMATNTAVPPTNTPTATNTAVPPTNTPTATNTAVPPTNTPTATNTAVPPTNTPTTVPTFTPTPSPTPVGLGYRDVGNVRIWADTFVDNGDTTTATGNVVLGSASTDTQYFDVAASASWDDTNTSIDLVGDVTMISAALTLADGNFAVDSTSGDLTFAGGNSIFYDTLGDSQLAITPTLSVNVLESTVGAQAQLVVALPEDQTIDALLTWTIEADGSITASADINLEFQLAGGTVTGSFSITDAGLYASQVQYSLPGITTVTIQDLLIDGAGIQKITIGASSTFPLPDLDLGDGVFVLSDLQATLGITGGTSGVEYMLELSGSLDLSGLPENSSVQVESFSFGIASGSVYGTLTNLQVEVAGRTMVLNQASFQRQDSVALRADSPQAYRYELVADTATWELPTPWQSTGETSLTLSQVTLMTEAPYIQIGGGGLAFSTTKTYYLGGSPTSTTSISFEGFSAAFAYTSAQNAWSVTLETTINFKFGKDSSTRAEGVQLVIANGEVSGSISSISLQVAGLTLAVGNMNYEENTFSAATVQLTLPSGWGSVSVSGLTITRNGISIGGAGGSFSIPDVSFGSTLKLSGMSGSFSIDGSGNYTISISATIKISGVSSGSNTNGATVSGSLTIKNGNVSGIINNFSFNITGVEFSVTNATFANNKMQAETVSLKLPSAIGGARTTVYGLTISSSGVSIRGGVIRLPDFTMAGVGVQNVQATLVKSGSMYTIEAGAKLNFTNFSVQGSFKLAYNTSNNKVTLQQVYISYSGKIPQSAIPLGSTGFYITTVWGKFDMTTNNLSISLGVRAETSFRVGNKALLGIDGSVTIKVKPSFEFRTSADADLLGLEIASVDVLITPTKFELDGDLRVGVIDASLELAFGKDTANEFTFYGKASMSLRISKGEFGKKWGVKIPPFNVNLGTVSMDAGKFKRGNSKVWGARYSGKVVGIRFFVFAQFNPSIGIDIGKNMSTYEPVRPALRPGEYPQLQPTEALYEVQVTEPLTQLLLVESISTTNQLDPMAVQVTAPNNAVVQQVLEYQEDDNSVRLITLQIDDPQAAVGTWQVIIHEDSEFGFLGNLGNPTIETFNVCLSANTCLDEATGAVTPLSIEAGQTLELDWSTSHVTESLTAIVYAEDHTGERDIVAEQYTADGLSLAGTASWSTLESGTYTLTLEVFNDVGDTSYHKKIPVVVNDTTAPAAPANFQATALPDGSVELTWNTPAAADVVGYEFTINTTTVLTEHEQLTSYYVYGLDVTEAHTVSAAAYDINGNMGTASTATVSLPSLSVVSSWPTRHLSASFVDHMRVTFNQPITVNSMSVENEAGLVSGTTSLLTETVAITGSQTIGALWLPTDDDLALGTYTATIQVQSVDTGTPQTVTWPFEVVAPASRVYLPTVQR